MPGTSGIKFIEKQLRQGCKVKKIAVMSGDWGDSGLVKAQELGCKVFKKPFSILDMKKWLEEIRKEFQDKTATIPLTFCKPNKKVDKKVNKKVTKKTFKPKPTASSLPLSKPIK
jgi:hypothetical protein